MSTAAVPQPAFAEREEELRLTICRDENERAYEVFEFTKDEEQQSERFRRAFADLDLLIRQSLRFTTTEKVVALTKLQQASFVAIRAIGANRRVAENVARTREQISNLVAGKTHEDAAEAIQQTADAQAPKLDDTAELPVDPRKGSETHMAGPGAEGSGAERKAGGLPGKSPQPAA